MVFFLVLVFHDNKIIIRYKIDLKYLLLLKESHPNIRYYYCVVDVEIEQLLKKKNKKTFSFLAYN